MRSGYHSGECDDIVMCDACAEKEKAAAYAERHTRDLLDELAESIIRLVLGDAGVAIVGNQRIGLQRRIRGMIWSHIEETRGK
jgi:hypothetical protein